MTSPFRFAGRIGRLPYALWSVAAFFSQHLMVWGAFRLHGLSPPIDGWFWVTPLRALVALHDASDALLLAGLLYLVIADWALAALACRRASDVAISSWNAAPAIAPILQVPTILLLCVLPSDRTQHRVAPADRIEQPGSWVPAAQGVVAGIGVTLFAVAIGALVFGTYGFGMFVLSPFLVGTMTGYFANRKADVGAGFTALLVLCTTALAAVALVLFALEGIVCIMFVGPLALAMALVGSLCGRAMALQLQGSARRTLSGAALLPLVFGLEAVLPPTARFDTVQTIEVRAPPAAVWRAVLRMDRMDEPPALPFRLGVAYPVRGEVIGEGVGALRRGEFSTGTAIERVTEWVAERKLAFTIERDVPAMHEMSPYRHVHAPHVAGYFRTTATSFELVARPGGRTGIVERTSHELRLDPVLYWLPMARWVVERNNARVLAHIRHQAESAVATACPQSCVSQND